MTMYFSARGGPGPGRAVGVEEQAEQVAGEVLAVRVHARTPGTGDGVEGPEGSRFWVARS